MVTPASTWHPSAIDTGGSRVTSLAIPTVWWTSMYRNSEPLHPIALDRTS